MLLWCLAWAVVPTLEAQTRLDTLHTLDEVTVTARLSSDETVPVQQLSGNQLQRLSVLSVADALRYFSGVQIKDYGGIGGLKTINVRSMGTNHVGVFYDGIELGNAQNSQIDLGRFSLDNMETVSLYNGQKSTLLQSAKDFASASSLYLRTREPVFADGRRQRWLLTFKTGSFDLVAPSLTWDWKLSEKVSMSLSGGYLYTSGRYHFTYQSEDGHDTTAVRHNGDVHALRLEGAVFGKIKDGQWRVRAYFYNSRRGYPGAVVRNKFSHEDRQWDTDFFLQGSWQRQWGRYTLLASAKYAYDYLHYLADPKRDSSTMYVENHYHQSEGYVSVAQRMNLTSWWDVSLSTDVQYNTLTADLTDFARPRRWTELVAAATSFSVGRLKAQASLLGSFVQHHVRAGATGASDRQEWTPAVTIGYKPFHDTDLCLRAFYKRIFRMPTLNDLYYTFIGNTQLRPEFTTQYDLGFTFTEPVSGCWLQDITVSADAYYNKVTDKIVAVPTSNFFRWTMLNFGKVHIEGVDASLCTLWKPIRDLTISTRMNYTWQLARDYTDSSDPYYKGMIPYSPRHSGSAVVNIDWKQWELNYSYIYTGERYTSRANISANYLEAWHTSDLALAYAFPLAAGHLRLALEVNNLFNERYEVVSCYPMPGTNFKVTARYTL